MDEIAYRDLKPGEVIQAGDEWQAKDGTGAWSAYHAGLHGLKVLDASKARRPYNITELLQQRDGWHRQFAAEGSARKLVIEERDEAERLLTEVRADEERLCQQLESLRSEYVTLQQQRDQAVHEYRLYRDGLTEEQAAHKATMANGLQACKERDEAEQALKMARASLDETRAARAFVIEERNEAERALSEERAAHVRTSNDRDRLIVELNECQQQRQHLQTALEELQRRRDTAEAGYQANTLTVGEVVGNILSALEIASHALESLADTGTNDEVAHWSGFIAAVQVVKKIKESAR